MLKSLQNGTVNLAKAIFANSFDFQTDEYSKTKSIQAFCLSFLGAFIFWCFSGVLTSLLTVPIKEVPIREHS